ncbi:MAG: T3SS effector HopA1 family protein [Janthinobacterium lividum]
MGPKIPVRFRELVRTVSAPEATLRQGTPASLVPASVLASAPAQLTALEAQASPLRPCLEPKQAVSTHLQAQRFSNRELADHLRASWLGKRTRKNARVPNAAHHTTAFANQPRAGGSTGMPGEGTNFADFLCFGEQVLTDFVRRKAGQPSTSPAVAPAGLRLDCFTEDRIAKFAYQRYSQVENMAEPIEANAAHDALVHVLQGLTQAHLEVRSQQAYFDKASSRPVFLHLAEFHTLDRQRAIHAHYFVKKRPQGNYPQSPAPLVAAQGRIDARYSVGVQTGQHAQLLQLLPELLIRFGASIDRIKVTSPATLGMRADDVIFYFARPDEGQAVSRAIARFLQTSLPGTVWRQPPQGMLRICNQSIDVGAYGETFTGTDDRKGYSFGRKRSEILAAAIINSLREAGSDLHLARRLLADALKREIEDAGYDPACPALIERANPALAASTDGNSKVDPRRDPVQ